MSELEVKLRQVREPKRKDPLIDIASLSDLGKAASKRAQKAALEQGVDIVLGVEGKVVRLKADGSKEVIGELNNDNFPSLEEDLCLP